MRPDAQAGARLDRLFIALADVNRRAMIARLSAGPASVSALAQRLNIALPSALKHLAVLEAGGLVRSDKAGRVRTFHMVPNAFRGLEAWVAKRKAMWNRQFDALDQYLKDSDR
jgi:DNA-binding transcriptional ArsR family regulator